MVTAVRRSLSTLIRNPPANGVGRSTGHGGGCVSAIVHGPQLDPRPVSAAQSMSASLQKRTSKRLPCYVRFSNRPFRVKRFQTIHRYSVDVAHGLALLFGLGTKALVWGFLSQAG